MTQSNQCRATKPHTILSGVSCTEPTDRAVHAHSVHQSPHASVIPITTRQCGQSSSKHLMLLTLQKTCCCCDPSFHHTFSAHSLPCDFIYKEWPVHAISDGRRPSLSMLRKRSVWTSTPVFKCNRPNNNEHLPTHAAAQYPRADIVLANSLPGIRWMVGELVRQDYFPA